MHVCVTNESKGLVVAPRARVATSLGERFLGLLGTASLALGEGLWITPCPSVHTFFMRYPIDILFLDKDGIVISQRTLVPWRFSRWEGKAVGVLELAAGAIELTGTQVGDHLTLKSI